MSRLQLFRGPLALSFLIPLGFLAGCGGESGGARAVPAAGTVLHKGKPVESGSIQFVPAEGRAASGAIENGKFTLSTYADGDGAIPGTHQVAVSSTKQGTKIKNGEPEIIFLVPEVYSNPMTSDTVTTVPPEGKTDIEINLP